MITENLTREILHQYFSEYEKHNVLIFAVFTLLIALINIIQGVFITSKLEKYKSQLKKTELKFSIYNELQIKSLSTLFHHLTELKIITISISISESLIYEDYKKVVIDWTNKFYETTNFFSREKYILPIEVKTQYSKIYQNFKPILDYIEDKKKLKSNFYTDQCGDEFLAGDEENVNELTQKLRQYNRDKIFAETIEHIESIRREIELYFQNI